MVKRVNQGANHHLNWIKVKDQMKNLHLINNEAH